MSLLLRVTSGSLRTSAPLFTRALLPACVPMLRRLSTKLDVYAEPEHISPIELEKFFRMRSRGAKEYLEEDEEILARESFNVDREVPTTEEGSHLGKSKAVNEEFAKQIQSLLHPDYGTETK
ncbi:hypothetical protein GGF43_004624 [Coemansia sp. RSA 2618]|nr:hypothetical protein GGF43_004624 [Coemansia sp. RSA 2618]